jgi:hypothetical protein
MTIDGKDGNNIRKHMLVTSMNSPEWIERVSVPKGRWTSAFRG